VKNCKWFNRKEADAESPNMMVTRHFILTYKLKKNYKYDIKLLV